MCLVTSRISGISMDMAVPENTGQDSALEVEQCTCPPGYRGPSCQVSLGPPPVHPTSFTVLAGLSSFFSPHMVSPPPVIFLFPGL